MEYAVSWLKNWIEDAVDGALSLFGSTGMIGRIAAITIASAVVLFTVVFFIEYHIDDDPNMKPSPTFIVEGGSKAVTMAETLMSIEVAHWAPSQLWFDPIRHSSNMTSYQRGLQYAVAQWVTQMTDFLGRERGSGEPGDTYSPANHQMRM